MTLLSHQMVMDNYYVNSVYEQKNRLSEEMIKELQRSNCTAALGNLSVFSQS